MFEAAGMDYESVTCSHEATTDYNWHTIQWSWKLITQFCHPTPPSKINLKNTCKCFFLL